MTTKASTPAARRARSALVALAVLSSAAGLARAEVVVSDAWARATVAQQKASGAFMRLVSSEDARLVGVSSPVAGLAEIHEMAIDDGVMKMRPVDGVALPRGEAVELRPGGHHVMLMKLAKPLEAGTTIPLTLEIENAAGARRSVAIDVPVKPLTTPAHGHAGDRGAAPGHGSGHGHAGRH